MSKLPDADFERAVLSAIIFDPAILDSISVDYSDFYHKWHQNIFKAMKALEEAGEPIEEAFLRSYMTSNNTFDEVAFLDLLSTNPITNVNAYLKTIKTATRNARYELELKQVVGNENLSLQQKAQVIKDITEDFESNSNEIEFITGEDLINMEFEDVPRYLTGIDFIDDIFDGFELGQLITVTGQQDTGKTQLTNQILLNVLDGHKALVFSLEFNRRKLRDFLLTKRKHNLKNLTTITQDMVTGEIDEIVNIIRNSYRKNDTKFVVIDSQIMLFDDSKKFNTTEEEITSFYRKLHKIANDLDILLFVIATKSLSSSTNKSRGIEIFGSKKAAHFADIMLDLSFADEVDIKNTDRGLLIGKNKQNGIHTGFDIAFDQRALLFKKKLGYKIEHETTDNNHLPGDGLEKF